MFGNIFKAALDVQWLQKLWRAEHFLQTTTYIHGFYNKNFPILKERKAFVFIEYVSCFDIGVREFVL